MATKPTPEKLATMGMEYDENGFIRKIGTKVHPAVKAAEEAAINKPKNIHHIEGYVDEPYPENINQEPIVLQFDGPVDGDDWAIRNEKSIADLLGAVETKLKQPVQSSESNPSGLIKTTGFDIEAAPAADSFKSALEFGQVTYDVINKKVVKSKISKATGLGKKNELFQTQPVNDNPPVQMDINRVYIGIDPGKSGGIVALSTNGEIIDKWVMPILGDNLDVPVIFELLTELKEKYSLAVVLEDVHSIFGMSAATNFTFGYVCGAIEAVVLCLKLKVIKVAPKTWQKEIWSNGDKVLKPKKPGQVNASTDTKATSLCAVVRLFPNEDLRKSARSKNAADGIVDALLLAEYGRRKNL